VCLSCRAGGHYLYDVVLVVNNKRIRKGTYQVYIRFVSNKTEERTKKVKKNVRYGQTNHPDRVWIRRDPVGDVVGCSSCVEQEKNTMELTKSVLTPY
jgi:hypothetical protein